jgi:hypothetical protein
MLTLSLGIAMTRAALDWGESALKELAALEAAGKDPKSKVTGPPS